MLDFSRRLTTQSFLRYAVWRLVGGQTAPVLRLRNGIRFRHYAADYGNAYEIFVSEVYKLLRPIEPDQVRLIVDLGANVGFSALYFLEQFPRARIIAFEPHPSHVERMARNLELNGKRDRVTLHAAGASNQAGRFSLSDRGMSSTFHPVDKSARMIEVNVVDIFEVLGRLRIDILKLDIEGSEYGILGDERFLALDIGAIAMEWHRNEELGGDEHAWLERRLAQAGFEIVDIFVQEHFGMLWAFKSSPEH